MVVIIVQLEQDEALFWTRCCELLHACMCDIDDIQVDQSNNSTKVLNCT